VLNSKGSTLQSNLSYRNTTSSIEDFQQHPGDGRVIEAGGDVKKKPLSENHTIKNSTRKRRRESSRASSSSTSSSLSSLPASKTASGSGNHSGTESSVDPNAFKFNDIPATAGLWPHPPYYNQQEQLLRNSGRKRDNSRMITNPFTLSSSSCSNITNSIPTMRVDQRKITGSSSEGISSGSQNTNLRDFVMSSATDPKAASKLASSPGRPLLDDDRKTHHLWARFQEINDFETVLQAYNRQYTLEALDDNYPAPSYWLVRCCLMVRFTDGFIGFIPCRLCKDISSTNNKNLKKRLEGHSVMKLKAIKCSFPPSPESPRRFLRFHNCYQGKKEELTVCNYDVSNDNSDKKAEEHQEDSKYDIVMGLTKEDRRKRGRNTKVYIKICDQLQAKTGPKEAFWCPVSTTGIYMKKKKKKKKEHCVFHIFSRNAIASVSYGLYRRNKFQKFVSMAGIPFELKLSPVIEQQHIVATATSSEAVMFPPQLPLNYKHQNHHLKASLSSMYTKSEMKAPPLLMPPQFEPLSAAAAAELPATVTTAATTQTIQTIPQKQKQHATRGIYQNNKAAEEADKGDDDNINDDHQMRKNRPIIESGKRREQETTEPLQQQQQQQGKNENESFLGVAAAITGTTTIGEAPQPPSGEASSSIDLYLPQRPHHPFPSIDSADDDGAKLKQQEQQQLHKQRLIQPHSFITSSSSSSSYLFNEPSMLSSNTASSSAYVPVPPLLLQPSQSLGASASSSILHSSEGEREGERKKVFTVGFVLDTYNGRMGSAEMIMQLYTTLEVLKHNIQANYLLVELMCSDEWKAVHGLATTFEHDRLPKVFKVMAEKDMNKQQQILQALQQILVDQWVIEPFRSNLAERVKSLLNKG